MASCQCLYCWSSYWKVVCLSPELRAGPQILPEGSRAGLGGWTTPAGHHVLQWVLQLSVSFSVSLRSFIVFLSPAVCLGVLSLLSSSHNNIFVLLTLVPQMALAWSVTTSRLLNSSTWPHRLGTSWPSTTWPRCMLLVLVWCVPATLL